MRSDLRGARGFLTLEGRVSCCAGAGATAADSAMSMMDGSERSAGGGYRCLLACFVLFLLLLLLLLLLLFEDADDAQSYNGAETCLRRWKVECPERRNEHKSERESLAASTTVIQSSPLLHLSDGQDPVPAETARKQEGQARGAVGESKQAGWESRQVLVGRCQVPGRQAGRQAGTVGRHCGQTGRRTRTSTVRACIKLEASKQCGSASASASDSRPSHSHSSLTLSSPKLVQAGSSSRTACLCAPAVSPSERCRAHSSNEIDI